MNCNIVLKVNDISYEFSSEQELNEKIAHKATVTKTNNLIAFIENSISYFYFFCNFLIASIALLRTSFISSFRSKNLSALSESGKSW